MRARAGGASTYKKVRPPRTIVLKSTLQKIFGFEFYEPTPPLARSARHPAKSMVLSPPSQVRILGIQPFPNCGGSVRVCSNLLYQKFLTNARMVKVHAPRAS